MSSFACIYLLSYKQAPLNTPKPNVQSCSFCLNEAVAQVYAILRLPAVPASATAVPCPASMLFRSPEIQLGFRQQQTNKNTRGMDDV
jgi:hypothetical protein